jgi:putative transposase
MIEQPNPLSLTRQCQLLGLSRAAIYYRPVEVSAEELELMAHIGRHHLRTPFYGSRRMTAWLQTGSQVNRKRVQRLTRLMGIEAVYGVGQGTLRLDPMGSNYLTGNVRIADS